jgi:hypothetical protein
VSFRLFSENVRLSPGSSVDSSDAMVAKVQQLPQFPWFLTGVTRPSCLRSYVAGRGADPTTSRRENGIALK